MQEALRYGVIPTVALPTHPGLYPVLGQELPLAGGTILAAAVRMHDESRSGPPLTDGHR